MVDNVVLEFKTAGLQETINEVNQLSNAQKQLQTFLASTANAYKALGQSEQQAKQSAQEFAQTNNITAQSFQQLSQRQNELQAGTKAINDLFKTMAQQTKDAAKASDDFAKSQASLVKAENDLATALKANQKAIADVSTAFNGNSKAALDAVQAYTRYTRSGADVSSVQTQLAKQLGVTNDQFKVIETTVNQTGKSVSSFSQVAVGALRALGEEAVQGGLGLLKTALLDFPKAAFQTTVQLESLDTALKFLSGSSGEAQKNLDFIRSTAQNLGVPLDSSEQAFIRLTAAARGTSLAGDTIRDLFTNVIGASRVLGSTNAQTEQSLVALEQIISKGTLSSQELKLQLGNALPGAFEVAARALGLTTQQLTKFLEQGKITSEQFIPAFSAQLKKEFGQGVTEALDAPQAALGRLANLGVELERAFGESITPAVLEFLKVIADNQDDLRKFVEILGQLAGGALGGVADIVNQTSTNFNNLKLAIDLTTESLSGFVNNPIIQTILSIGNAVDKTTGGFFGLNKILTDFKGNLVQALGFIQPGIKSFQDLSGILQSFAEIQGNKNIDEISTSVDKASQSALKYIQDTKNFTDALKGQTSISAENKLAVEGQISANNQEIDSLKALIKQKQEENVSTQEQKNAKQTAIAELNSQINAIDNQSKALQDSVKAIEASGQAQKLNSVQVREASEELKRNTEDIKENNKAQQEALETAAKRAEEDAKTQIKRKEEDQTNVLKTQESDATDALKATQQRQLQQIQLQNEQQIEKVKTDFERNTLQPLKLKQEQDIKDANAKFERDIIAPLKKANEQQIQQVQTAFNNTENEKKKQNELEIQRLTKAFNEQQNAAKKTFEDSLNKEKKTFDDQINKEQQQVERQLQLEDPKADKAKLQAQFDQEDKLAARRKELEAPIQAQKEAFQKKQQEEQLAYQKVEDQQKLDFETNTLNPVKTKQEQDIAQAKIDFEANVLNPLKLKLEDSVNQKKQEFETNVLNPLKLKNEQAIDDSKRNFETNVLTPLKIANEKKIDDTKLANEKALQAVKQSFEDKIRNLKRAAEDEERNLDRKYEDEKRAREHAFRENERKLDRDTQDAIEKIKDDNKQTKGGQSNTPTGAPNNQTATPPIRVSGGRREGGPVATGEAYVVGEVAPEIFVPNVNGFILNPEQVQDNLDTFLSVGTPSMPFNPNQGSITVQSDSAPLLAEMRQLREIVQNREQKIEIPTKIEERNGMTMKQYEAFLSLQRAVSRANI